MMGFALPNPSYKICQHARFTSPRRGEVGLRSKPGEGVLR
jgi:hypothetical protein